MVRPKTSGKIENCLVIFVRETKPGVSTMKSCGWASDYPTLREASTEAIVVSLQEFLSETNLSQISSWRTTVSVIQREAAVAVNGFQPASAFTAVLEYELPREGGRRPDVVALQNGVVVVIEFKGRAFPFPEHLDQVDAYARDLKHYHELSHDLDVVPVLVPTGYRGQTMQVGNVHVVAPNELGSFLIAQAKRSTGLIINPNAWINSPYAPLPSLVAAARMLFNGQELPRIKRAHSAKIPEVVDLLLSICHQAAEKKRRHLVFVTGAPGSGKTLVGLQLAHSQKLEDLKSTRGGKRNGAPAVLLSGNGPLVQVLQDALGTRAFVDGMKKFIEYYGFQRPALLPSEHVFIFDEAQRAWDEEHMEQKHGSRISEPRALLQIAERVPDWCVVVALVGEGQEIHKGEEAGLPNWKAAMEALPSNQSWTIHGADKLESIFKDAGASFEPSTLLNLSTSLRSHVASNLHAWVASALCSDGSNLEQLKQMAQQLREEGFPIYVTQDLEKAKAYVRERYNGVINARFGMVASRYAKNLAPLGIDNTYHFERAKQLKVGPWFNTEPTSPLSCCSLDRPATEFECQGLELDFPIVCWGDDFLCEQGRLQANRNRRRGVHNVHQVTLNAYRVLLTRGRDGMCIFVPDSTDSRFQATLEFLLSVGCAAL